MNTKQIKAFGTDSASEPLREITINRRTIHAHDVEFEVLYCGICHSDLHQIKADFGAFPPPIVPGHQILGSVTAVGDKMQFTAVFIHFFCVRR